MADDGRVRGSGRRMVRALSGRAGYALLLSLGAGRAAKSVNRARSAKGARKTLNTALHRSWMLAELRRATS